MPGVDSIADAKEAAIKSLRDASSSAAAAVDDGLQAASQAARSSAAFMKTNAERARDEGQARRDVLSELVKRSQILRAALRLVGLATIRRSRTSQRLPRLLCRSWTASVLLLKPPARSSQTYLDTGRAHAQHTQDIVFDRLKGASAAHTRPLAHGSGRLAPCASGASPVQTYMHSPSTHLAVRPAADGVHWVMANQEVAIAAVAVTGLVVLPGMPNMRLSLANQCRCETSPHLRQSSSLY